MKKPNLFLIGAAKCGTTSLYSYLKQHPEIFFPEHKEPHFFSKDLSWRYRGTEYKTLEDYLAIFKPAAEETWVGEASVWHLYSKVAAEEIHAFNPDAKLICILRNPVDMMHSLYRFGYKRGHEDAKTFREAIEKEPLRKTWKDVPKTLFLLNAIWYTQLASYGDQIERYLNLFPRENVKFLLFEDLKESPEKMVSEILQFLDVDTEIEIDYSPQNVSGELSLGRLRYLTRFHPQISHQVGKIVPQFLKEQLHSIMGTYKRATPIDANTLPEDMRRELTERHRLSIEKTARLIGRDLAEWLN